jgi:hypothetical protein
MTACLAADERNRQLYRWRSSLSRGIYTSRIKCETATQMFVRLAHRNFPRYVVYIWCCWIRAVPAAMLWTRGLKLMCLKRIALQTLLDCMALQTVTDSCLHDGSARQRNAMRCRQRYAHHGCKCSAGHLQPCSGSADLQPADQLPLGSVVTSPD